MKLLHAELTAVNLKCHIIEAQVATAISSGSCRDWKQCMPTYICLD